MPQHHCVVEDYLLQEVTTNDNMLTKHVQCAMLTMIHSLFVSIVSDIAPGEIILSELPTLSYATEFFTEEQLEQVRKLSEGKRVVEERKLRMKVFFNIVTQIEQRCSLKFLSYHHAPLY